MENTNQQTEERVASPEEIAQQQKELSEFYDKQSEFLEKKKRYLSLLTDIDELTFKRVRIQQAFAQMMYEQENGSPIPDMPEEETPETTKAAKDHSKGFRKLKNSK